MNTKQSRGGLGVITGWNLVYKVVFATGREEFCPVVESGFEGGREAISKCGSV